MSHFAKVIRGVVVDVIVAEQSFIDSGLVGPATDWMQTSYNTRGGVHYGQDGKPDGAVALRANYAGIGDTYDVVNDVFYSPQPFPSWTISAPTWLWQPPICCPDDGTDYVWDELTGCWVAGGR
jgi:hypothetical protein